MSAKNPNAMLQPIEGPSPVSAIAIDMVKRGAVVAPVLIAIGALIWQTVGALTVAYGLGLVLFNFLVSAALVTWGGRISLALMMGAVMFGFLVRLAIVFVAIYVVRDAEWIHLTALGVTIIVTHLGLLFWELRYVSASLAFPGLKPGTTSSPLSKEPSHQ